MSGARRTDLPIPHHPGHVGSTAPHYHITVMVVDIRPPLHTDNTFSSNGHTLVEAKDIVSMTRLDHHSSELETPATDKPMHGSYTEILDETRNKISGNPRRRVAGCTAWPARPEAWDQPSKLRASSHPRTSDGHLTPWRSGAEASVRRLWVGTIFLRCLPDGILAVINLGVGSLI